MLTIKLVLLLVFLQLWTLALSTNNSSCVDTYFDFEEQTFGNNSENRMKLYQAFYPPNDHLPYSVVVSYQAVLPNGTKVNISTDPSCRADRQVWLWVSSPFLLVMDPTELNRLVLYTLNHFTEWVPPHLTIATPLPCSAEAKGFLKLMTSSVSSTVVVASSHVYIKFLVCTELFTFCCSSSTQLQAYALGEMSKGEHLGYSRQGCTIPAATSITLKDESSAVSIYRIIGASGFVSLAFFESVASVLLLQVLLKALSQKMESCNYSFDYYGMFWGMSAILCLLFIVLLFSYINHLSHFVFNPDIQQTKYVRYMWPFVLAFPMIFCAPVAIYFGVKFNLSTPSVYLLPAKLLCCCSKKRARALVLSLTLWFDLVSTFVLVGHGIAFLNAFPVAPFAVTVNMLLLVLTSTCLTYIMALIFTICAFVGSRRCLSNSPDCLATVRAAMLIPLLFTVICFSLFVVLIGQFVNIATQQSSFHMMLKSLFAPVLLFVVSLSLKRFISVWMHWSLSGVEDESQEANSLRRHDYQEYQVLDNV